MWDVLSFQSKREELSYCIFDIDLVFREDNLFIESVIWLRFLIMDSIKNQLCA